MISCVSVSCAVVQFKVSSRIATSLYFTAVNACTKGSDRKQYVKNAWIAKVRGNSLPGILWILCIPTSSYSKNAAIVEFSKSSMLL